MNQMDYVLKLFDESQKRAKESYKTEKKKEDTRTARSSSLYNAMKIMRDNGTVG